MLWSVVVVVNDDLMLWRQMLRCVIVDRNELLHSF